jgi:hypothetical protein
VSGRGAGGTGMATAGTMPAGVATVSPTARVEGAGVGTATVAEGTLATGDGDGTCARAAATAACAGAGTTFETWPSASKPGPEASAPAGTISASVRSASVSAPHNPRNFASR